TGAAWPWRRGEAGAAARPPAAPAGAPPPDPSRHRGRARAPEGAPAPPSLPDPAPPATAAAVPRGRGGAVPPVDSGSGPLRARAHLPTGVDTFGASTRVRPHLSAAAAAVLPRCTGG